MQKILSDIIDLKDLINNHITDVIWVYDLQKQCFTFISPSVYLLRGITQEEALKEELAHSLHPDDADYINNHLQSRILHYEMGEESLKSLTSEIRQPHKNGSYVWVEVTTLLIKNSEGKVTSICGVSRDITHRKADEQILRNSRNIFETVFSFTGSGIALLNKEGNFKNVNRGFCNMLGYPKSFVMEKSFSYFLAPGDDKVIQEIFDIARNEKNYERQTEVRFINVHHQEIWGLLNINGIISPQTYEMQWVIQIQDNTKRKNAEATIQSLNEDLKIKNQEMEQLVYVTSHDLRSPLVNIKGFNGELLVSFNELKKRLRDNLGNEHEELFTDIEAEIKESFEFINISINKMDSLLRGLLDYSRLRRKYTSPMQINMNKLIANVVQTNEFVIKSKEIDLDISTLPHCWGSEEMINQAFSNLIENSLKYMSKTRRGKIIIRGFSQEGWSVFSLEDNGIGFKPELKDKIFELFFRIDPENRDGDGLGLSAVKKIIELNGGKIQAESSQGNGSKFTVYLPVQKKQM